MLGLRQFIAIGVEQHELKYWLAAAVFEQVLSCKGEPRILQFNIYDRPQLGIQGTGVHLHEHFRKLFNSLRTQIQAVPEQDGFLHRCGAQAAGLAMFTIVARILIGAAWCSTRQLPQTCSYKHHCSVSASKKSRACSALEAQLRIVLVNSVNAQRLKYNCT